MKTAIIMVTYNGWPITQNCLADLAALPQDNFVIAVADNASTDGTVENILPPNGKPRVRTSKQCGSPRTQG